MFISSSLDLGHYCGYFSHKNMPAMYIVELQNVCASPIQIPQPNRLQ
jgi:hypothetical protein